MNKRVSGYDLLPGKLSALTKYITFIVTQHFIYNSQLSVSTYTGTHNLGTTNLFMCWDLGDRINSNYPSPETYESTTSAQQLPLAKYYYYDTDPDPKNEVYASYPAFNWDVAMNKTTFDIRYDAVYGPIGTTNVAYLRVTIFNDSFEAPLVAPVVS